MVKNNNSSSESLFSEVWFKEHIETSIADLGHRYTPKLNVELDISKKFDAICRNDTFRKQMGEVFHELLLAIKSVESPLHQLDFLRVHYNKFISARETLEEIYDSTQKSNLQEIQTELLQNGCRSIGDIVSDCIAIINEKVDEDYKGNERHGLRQTEQAIYSFISFIKDQYFDLANQPLMLLSGEAGVGKSHLLADIVSNRSKEGKPCILLLGQQFISENNPWTQILDNHVRLGFRNEDELLSELNAIAEKNNERMLFIIDAINEGQGCIFWPDHIKGFLRKVSKYPWVGLVLSIRSSYEKLLTPPDLISSDEVIRVVHSGFSSVEYQASSHFFAQYRIEQPSIPLLHPEFSNPLFLKLFCEGLHRSGLSKIPKGYAGISSIINFFMDSIDKKLCMPKSFDYPCDQHLVRKVVDELIHYKFKNNILLAIERLSKQLEEVQESYDLETRVEEKHRLKPIIDRKQRELEKEKSAELSARDTIHGNFIPYTIAVDIAEKTLAKFSNKRRFLDALISEGVLSKNLYWHADGKHEEGIYLAYERFEDHFTALHLLDRYQTQEQLKTAFSKDNELEHLITYHSKRGILEALSILIPEQFGFELYELIDEDKRSSDAVMLTFINSLLWRKTETIGDKSREYINRYILRYEETYYEFFKLVYSVAADPDHPYNSNSLHRYLMPLSMADRDAKWTTFLHKQNYEGFAMPRFINWALSEYDKSYLSDESRLLAGKALAWIFPSTNIPFRDSATEGLVNLLENNLPVAIKLLIEFEEVNDPYVYERIFAATYGAVLRSTDLEGLGDLSQYIVEYLFEQEGEIYPNVLVRDYARNIVEFALYKELIELEDKELIRPPYRSDFPDSFPSNDEIDAYKYDYNSDDFKNYYWGQDSILSSMVTEYGRGTGGYGDFGRYTFQSNVHDWGDFDPNDLSNYACKLIFGKYGYDVEMHGKFDRNISHGSRHGNKVERIGKKYQWIALYEVMARLSDNRQMIDESTRWGDEKEYIWYQGTWEPFVRNIDPTAKVFSPKAKNKKKVNNWWEKFNYNDWELDKKDWLRTDNNLPCDSQLISIYDLNGVEWLVLESYQNWAEPIPIGEKKHKYPHKELWVMLKSVLVKKGDYQYLYSWMKKQHFWGRWFPEGRDNQYQVFCREYYWSPAYHFFEKPYYRGTQWNMVTEPYPSNREICEVSPTTEKHIWESGANYDDAPNYLAPRQHMFEGMELEYSDNIGEWLDKNGDLACFDPSVNSDEYSCLLIRKDIFQKYLDNYDLKVIWTCLGEKQISGLGFGSQSPYPLGIQFSGVLTLDRSNIKGGLTQLVSPDT